MATVLQEIVFDAGRFEQEMKRFRELLRRPTLSETRDLQPLFKECNNLTAYMGTFAPNIAVATELCCEFDVFGDYRADILLGSRKYKEFCVIELENGEDDAIFKKQQRKYPEWSSRFEHGFSQIVDWFCNLDDFKKTSSFAATFGSGEIGFTGLLVMGRNAGLDATMRNRLKWRTEKVVIDSHKVSCITFDDLYETLENKFRLYRDASQLEQTQD